MERTVVCRLLSLLIKKLDLTHKVKNGEVKTNADLLAREICEGLYQTLGLLARGRRL